MNSIESFLEACRVDLIKQQADRGLRASGASANSLRIESSETEGELYGSKYFYQQIHGRKPGKFPGTSLEEAIDNMLAWIRVCGITPDDPNMSERTLAFLFARKLKTQGSDIWLGKKEGIDLQLIINKNIFKLKQDILKELSLSVINHLKKK